MKRIVALLTAGLATQAGAADLAVFDCNLGDVYSVTADATGKVAANPLDLSKVLAGKSWKFGLTIKEKTIVVDWPDSPIQFAGESPLIQTGAASFASFLVGRGPCLFTKAHCGAQLHFSRLSDGSLKFQLQPVALLRRQDGLDEPFVVYIDGTCKVKEASE